MTITDIGILLVVLCVLLWAVMAALHRHTVQLNGLKQQLDQVRDELHAARVSQARDQPAADVHSSPHTKPNVGRFSGTPHHS
jgi:hypothetical protein